MRILTIVFFFLLSAAANAGTIITDSIQSKVLSSGVKYNVYLPSGYGKTDRKYPVVYLLHGLSDTYEAWQERGRMKDVADELISSGEADEMVIIMPNAGGPDVHNTWNGYFNMPGWNYEDFFFDEFLPEVERKYNIIGDREHRAVMGLSMGGGGSTVYAQRHPDMFIACFAMSAWLDNESGQVGENGQKDKLYYVCEAVKENSAIKFVEQADEPTIEKMRTISWFFDCGDDDFLFDLSARIHQLMRDKNIKHELRVRNGVHNWEYWHHSIRLALPYVSRCFK